METSFDSDGEIVAYQWSSGETTASIEVTVNETSTWSVSVSDNLGTTTSASVTLSVETLATTTTMACSMKAAQIFIRERLADICYKLTMQISATA